MACYNYCVTYYPVDLPIDLYVRYSRCSDDTTVTELISTLDTIDNGDGTYTACVCVSDTGSYPTPVCVQGGFEITCPTGIVWVYDSPCSSVTPTPTPTPTLTPTEPYDIYLFEECGNSSNQFRFENVPGTLSVGDVYSISGPYFNGFATVITYSAVGTVYSSSGSVFIGESACPTPTPTPTVTQTQTPTNTPTPSNTPSGGITPSGCTYTNFCFYTNLSSLSGYSGNYVEGSTYNGLPSYSGDGTTIGVIYYYTGITGNYWCLSDSLGGTCYLKGASPCQSDCPDISANDFTSGICPTPTPTAVNCSIFDFNAYFDCDWEPLPTPTPSIACDDVNFTFDYFGVTPTPSPTNNSCGSVGISFSMSGYTPAVTPTVTLTPSVTLTKTVDVQGQATFQMLDETFSCVSVKVLTDCQTGEEYYVTNGLSFNGVPVVIGMTMLVDLNGSLHCVSYTSDNDNFSSNANVGDILQLYSICGNCTIVPTPTPTPTMTSTPTNTPTTTLTATPTSTIGTTPLPTSTPTPTNTSTPTSTPHYVYVYESCNPISPNVNKTQVIQNLKSPIVSTEGQCFKVDGVCWNYLGRFDTNYIAPSNVFSIIFEGDFFNGETSDVYVDCNSCITSTPVITTATLSFVSYDIGKFYFTITPAISTTVTITNCVISGYDDDNGVCRNITTQDYMLTSAIIPSGETFTSVDGQYPLGCDSSWYRQANNMTVNGFGGLQDGGTITIGGVSITIVINNTSICASYVCE